MVKTATAMLNIQHRLQETLKGIVAHEFVDWMGNQIHIFRGRILSFECLISA